MAKLTTKELAHYRGMHWDERIYIRDALQTTVAQRRMRWFGLGGRGGTDRTAMCPGSYALVPIARPDGTAFCPACGEVQVVELHGEVATHDRVTR